MKKWTKQQLAKYLCKQSHKPLGLWRHRVLKRDNHICCQCQEKANVAHHIQPKGVFKSLTCDDDNGVSLCESCHNILHTTQQKYNHRTGEVIYYP